MIVSALLLVANLVLPWFQVFAYEPQDWDVACIGGTLDACYTTLEAAISAANSGDEIIMQSGYDITQIAKITITKNLTIDLNGKSITKSVEGTTEYIFQVNWGKTLTIKDTWTNWKISRENWLTAIMVLWTLNVVSGIIESVNWCPATQAWCNWSTIAIKVDENGVWNYWTANIEWWTINWWQAIQSRWSTTINWWTLNGDADAWSYQYNWTPWNPGSIVINDWATINWNVWSLQYDYYDWSKNHWYPNVQSNVTINGWVVNWTVSTEFRKGPLDTVIDENPWEATPAIIQISWWTFSNQPDASYIVEWKAAVQNGDVYNIVNTYTVKFDANAEWVENPADQKVAHWNKAEKPNNPSNTGKVLMWWYLNDEEFDFNTPITADITLTWKWEAMSDSTWGVVDQEFTWVILEAEEPTLTSSEESNITTLIASSNSTAEMEWIAELKVYKDVDWDGNKDSEDTLLTSKVNFTSPVVVRIPVNTTWSVKVKVKHNGESTFGTEWLTTDGNAACSAGVATPAYNWEDIPVTSWYVEIYTCSASTFVAYTEETNQSSSSSSSSWWWGGSHNNNSTDKETWTSDTWDTVGADTTWVDEWTNEENKTLTAEEEKAAVEKFWQEQIDAYKWALENGITTMKTVESARLDQPLTRAELAKMMVVYIQKVVEKDPALTWDVTYADVDESLGDLAGYIKLAYQYQIMWINADGTPIEKFNPYGLVTRGEYATVFSRVLFGSKFNKEWADFYTNHLAALARAGILTNTTPTIQEIRGWVMLMMYRSSQNSEKIQTVASETEEVNEEEKAETPANEETVSEEVTEETTVTEENNTEVNEEDSSDKTEEDTSKETTENSETPTESETTEATWDTVSE